MTCTAVFIKRNALTLNAEVIQLQTVLILDNSFQVHCEQYRRDK